MPHDAATSRPRRLGRRLFWSTALAVGGVVAATVMVPSYSGDGAGEAKALLNAYDRAAQGRDAAGADPGGVDESEPHTHNDPATKNDLSRSENAAATEDPTSPAQAERAVRSVEAQRAERDPQLVKVPRTPERRATPQNRYAMAGGCYALRAPNGRWVARAGTGYATTATSRSGAEPFHLQATTLGKYLLFDSQQRFLAVSTNPLSPGVTAADAPGDRAVWAVRKPGGFTFRSSGEGLRSGRSMALGDAQQLTLRTVSGCASWPEITTNIGGRAFAGTSGIQEVRGTADAHTHGMAFEFLGGKAHCGRPWSPFGVAVAMADCPDHSGDGAAAALENLTRTGSPVGTHDTTGWPTFNDWPAPDSLTHEGTYYKWMERAHQGGMRLFVNLLVENNQLCTIYPLKKNSCDDMDSIRLQAKRMRQLEDYVDAQHGGPGKGWYRIVTNPFQARRVVNAGKLAVVMGIETSVPFGCSMLLGNVPQCSASEIDRQLDEVHDLGVRQMELVNKFDNALSGVAGDDGAIGALINGANYLETESFWDMRTCPTDFAEGVQDRDQATLGQGGELFGARDGLFGAVAEIAGVPLPAVPLYGPVPHCNARDLTSLGEHTIRQLVERQMLFDPDHMSVKARQSSLDLLEELDYSGVLSSHSWSTPDAYPRIYELGGVVMPYAGDSTGFVEKWEKHLTWADPRYYFGFGYGADINGLGAQGDPRGAGATRPVTYPFKGLGGVTVRKQRSGERVYDVNVDGVAHYGLYPDWLQDLRMLGGDEIVDDMSRGAEAYLQMWERAAGVGNDACREPSVAQRLSVFRDLRKGLTVRQVLMRAGQPHSRLDTRFTYCAKKPGRTAKVRVDFTDAGRLLRVT